MLEIAPEEQFLPLSTIFYYLMLDFYVKTGIRFSLRDKRLFEITEVEITRVDCIFKSATCFSLEPRAPSLHPPTTNIPNAHFILAPAPISMYMICIRIQCLCNPPPSPPPTTHTPQPTPGSYGTYTRKLSFLANTVRNSAIRQVQNTYIHVL